MRIFVFAILVCLVAAAHASMNVTLPASSCANSTDILSTLNTMPSCITESFLTTVASGAVYTSQQFMDSSINFITASPDPHWFCSQYNQIMALIESLYTIALMGVGLYYIIQSPDVEGRIRAKTWLKDAFFMIVLLAFSFYLFDALLSINQYFITSLVNSTITQVFNTNISFVSLIFALLVLGSMLFAVAITFFTLLARYLLIPFLLLLSPVSIFLYFMPFGKEWGGAFLKATMLIVFMGAIDAIFIFGLAALFNSSDPNLASPFIESMGIVLGFGLIGFLNLALFFVAALTIASPVLDQAKGLKWLAVPAIIGML